MSDETGGDSQSQPAEDDIADDQLVDDEFADDELIDDEMIDDEIVEHQIVAHVVGEDQPFASPERAAIEAVLMVANDPVSSQLLSELLEISLDDVEKLLEELTASYRREGRGFMVARVAGGYRFQSHPSFRAYVERFILDDVPHRLSPAALETLAIVAYKQPISRVQIATIRGVNVDGVMRVLTQRGYVEPIGRDSGPGQAVLFGTTTMFLERLGIDNLSELPPLESFVPDADTVEALEHLLRPDEEP